MILFDLPNKIILVDFVIDIDNYTVLEPFVNGTPIVIFVGF